MSGQSHNSSACYPPKNIITNKQETIGLQGPLWTFWRRGKTSYPLPEFEPRITQLLATSLYLLRYPDPDVTMYMDIRAINPSVQFQGII